VTIAIAAAGFIIVLFLANLFDGWRNKRAWLKLCPIKPEWPKAKEMSPAMQALPDFVFPLAALARQQGVRLDCGSLLRDVSQYMNCDSSSLQAQLAVQQGLQQSLNPPPLSSLLGQDQLTGRYTMLGNDWARMSGQTYTATNTTQPLSNILGFPSIF
jgi:hypothetical protein